MPSARATPRAGEDERGLRVLLAAHQQFGHGGIATVARGLAEHLPAVIGPSEELTIAAPTSHRLGAPGPAGAAVRIAYEQLRLARMAHPYDLVHLCDLRPLLLTRTPFVITVHDVDFVDRPGLTPGPARIYKTAMLRAALRKGPAAIICDSAYTCERLVQHFPRADSFEPEVIHPGVGQGEGTWTGGGEPPYLLTVGAIIPRKNHLLLLRAFREARARGLEAEWWIAGEPGPGSRDILGQLRREPGVRLLGTKSTNELDALYREALLVATPSLSEGFGYPPLEAMARGVPAMSSDGGALPEVVGDAGLLLPSSDAAAWAEALLQLAGDSAARKELSERGRARAEEFSWRRCAERVVSLYRRICGGLRTSRRTT